MGEFGWNFWKHTFSFSVIHSFEAQNAHNFLHSLRVVFGAAFQAQMAVNCPFDFDSIECTSTKPGGIGFKESFFTNDSIRRIQFEFWWKPISSETFERNVNLRLQTGVTENLESVEIAELRQVVAFVDAAAYVFTTKQIWWKDEVWPTSPAKLKKVDFSLKPDGLLYCPTLMQHLELFLRAETHFKWKNSPSQKNGPDQKLVETFTFDPIRKQVSENWKSDELFAFRVFDLLKLCFGIFAIFTQGWKNFNQPNWILTLFVKKISLTEITGDGTVEKS